jgi:hypothetical protein
LLVEKKVAAGHADGVKRPAVKGIIGLHPLVGVRIVLRESGDASEKKERSQKELMKTQHTSTLHALKLSMLLGLRDAPPGNGPVIYIGRVNVKVEITKEHDCWLSRSQISGNCAWSKRLQNQEAWWRQGRNQGICARNEREQVRAFRAAGALY